MLIRLVRRPATGRTAPRDTLSGRAWSRRTIAVAVSAAIATGAASGMVLAYLSGSSAVAANEFTTGRIFPGERVTSAYDVRDASSGSEVDASSELAFAGDGRTVTTAAWATSFASDRYLDFELDQPLPGGIPVSSVAFQLDYASGGASDTTCYYLELRRASTSALEATYGSSANPLGCVTGTTLTSASTSLAAVSTSDLANDLRIRLYARNSGSGTMRVDRATVTGTGYASFALYTWVLSDLADTTPDVTRWPLKAGT
jgi:hypothetical protein